jgi:hypothetical protein
MMQPATPDAGLEECSSRKSSHALTGRHLVGRGETWHAVLRESCFSICCDLLFFLR